MWRGFSFLVLVLLACAVLPAIIAHPGAALAFGLFGTIGLSRRRPLLKQEGGEGGGLTPEEFQSKVLKGVEALTAQGKTLEERIGKAATVEELAKLKGDFDKLVEDCRNLRKSQLSASARQANSNGKVTVDCARYLGALALQRSINKGLIADGIDRAKGLAADVLGAEFTAKAALTPSEIPLPTEYSGEVVELVSQYGQARKYGTPFPLPSGTVKLPKLSTSPAFGLIAMSAPIPQKSPAFAWVTFNAEKWGGLIILPNEINEDSIVGVGQFVARYAAREMAKVEDIVFFTADGTPTYDSLEGLTKSVVTDSKTVALASTKVKFSDATLAKFRELRTTVDSAALGSSKYYLHPTFEQLLVSFNSNGDKPYIANGINGASLDGFPIVWIDTMPPYSTANNAAAVFALFGDASYQYLGTRGGMRFDMSDAPGFANDQLYIRALERFTIGKMATGCVGGLLTAAS